MASWLHYSGFTFAHFGRFKVSEFKFVDYFGVLGIFGVIFIIILDLPHNLHLLRS